jgi:hypothetical protein
MRYQTAGVALAVCMLAIVVASMPHRALADCSGSVSRPIVLGVSGGNIHSFNKKHTFCFSGTLGSMVQDGSGTQFILSNNHVLDDINKGKRGDPIVQPGLADVACVQDPTTAVANLSRAVKINFGGGNNTVDAAIAEVIPGDVSSDIMNIGSIASTTVAASPGLAVQKQGTTTCLTTATISGVGMHGKINYGKGKSARFVNQIVINGPPPPNNFGGPGDSGSLIVTQDPCPQAVGLLFAGSGDQTQTIANPISSVLSKLNVSMTGGCTAAVTAPSAALEQAGTATVSKDLVDSATAVRDRHEDELMKIPGAVGTAIGMSDRPGQPAIEVYIDKMTPEARAKAPKEVEGLPVKLIENGGFVAY